MSDDLRAARHVFRLEPDWYVAESMDEALALYEAQTGDPFDDDGCAEKWQLRDDEALSIVCDDQGAISDHGRAMRLIAKQWAAREPKGLLCSEEY